MSHATLIIVTQAVIRYACIILCREKVILSLSITWIMHCMLYTRDSYAKMPHLLALLFYGWCWVRKVQGLVVRE